MLVNSWLSRTLYPDLKTCYYVLFQWLAGAGRFFVLVCQAAGMNVEVVGLAFGLSRLVAFWVNMWTSAYADTYKNQRDIAAVLSVLRCVPLLAIIGMTYYGGSTVLFCILAFIMTLFQQSVVPFAESLAIPMLREQDHYGYIRMWAALGFGTSHVIQGLMFNYTTGYWTLFVFVGFTMIALPICIMKFLPKTVVHRTTRAGASVVKSEVSLKDTFKWALSSRAVIVLSLTVVSVGAQIALVENLVFSTLINDMNGATPIILGSTVMVSIMPEIPIFQFAPYFLKNYGYMPMMVVGMISVAVRSLCYSFITDAVWSLVLELFHGVTIGFFWTAAVDTYSTIAPMGMETSVQVILDLAWNGFGMAFGVAVGGTMLQQLGPVVTYQAFSIFQWVMLVVFLLFCQPKQLYAACGLRGSQSTRPIGDHESGAAKNPGSEPETMGNNDTVNSGTRMGASHENPLRATSNELPRQRSIRN